MAFERLIHHKGKDLMGFDETSTTPIIQLGIYGITVLTPTPNLNLILTLIVGFYIWDHLPPVLSSLSNIWGYLEVFIGTSPITKGIIFFGLLELLSQAAMSAIMPVICCRDLKY